MNQTGKVGAGAKNVKVVQEGKGSTTEPAGKGVRGGWGWVRVSIQG